MEDSEEERRAVARADTDRTTVYAETRQPWAAKQMLRVLHVEGLV